MATCITAAFLLYQPEVHPWFLIIVTDQTRCRPNMQLCYFPKPQNLHCSHPSKQSLDFILLWNSFSTPLPLHTHFFLRLFKICLPASTRKPASSLQVTRRAAFGLLPFLSSLHSPASTPPPLLLSSLLDHLLALLAWEPHAVLVLEPETPGREFSGSEEDKHAFEGRLLRSKASSRCKASSCRGLNPTHNSLDTWGGSSCSKRRLWAHDTHFPHHFLTMSRAATAPLNHCFLSFNMGKMMPALITLQ